MPLSALDHAGFRAWVKSAAFPPGVCATWVAGEVFLEMSPESIESHAKAKLEITVVLGALVRDENLGEAYPDRVLFTNETAGVSTEPDFAFASWARLADGTLQMVAKADRDGEYVEVQGTLDLVVEIVSDSSVRKDLVRLREAYARAGIGEYWTVDARGSDVKLEISRLAEGVYRPSAPAGEAQPSALFGRTFRLTRSRNPAGRWSYRLSVE